MDLNFERMSLYLTRIVLANWRMSNGVLEREEHGFWSRAMINNMQTLPFLSRKLCTFIGLVLLET